MYSMYPGIYEIQYIQGLFLAKVWHFPKAWKVRSYWQKKVRKWIGSTVYEAKQWL